MALNRDTSPRWWAPWLGLVLAVTVPASYAVSMLLPYYVNDLDRFPLGDMPWGVDYTELWPYDTAYSFPVGLAGIYALLATPFVTVGLLAWSGLWMFTYGRVAPWSAWSGTLLTVAVCLATIGWLTTPLANTLVSWWMD